MAKRALFVATVGGFLGFERSDMGILQSMGYEVHCAANFKGSPLDDFKADGVIRHQVDFARTPWRRTNIAAYRQLKALLARGRFDLVHCHTPMGGVVARIAAQPYRKKKETKVIYTAHGFHFFKGAPLKNWLLYFPVEWLLAHWTDVLITINKEDYRLAKRCMRAGRVEYIPGVGIDAKKLEDGHAPRDQVRGELGVAPDDFVLLSVGELSKRKNASVVIQALSRLANERAQYFICGTGPEDESLISLARSLGLEGRVHLLGFRSDIAELLGAADLFVFPSLQEGLPVALMEAIASRTPVICSDIRGNTDLVPEGELLFDPRDVESVLRCLERAMNMPGDEARSLAEGHCEALKKYDLERVAKKMGMTYRQALSMRQGEYGGVLALIRKQAMLSELGIEGFAYVILSAGELSERKNQETVIRALAMLGRKDIAYLVAGDGELRDRLQNLIQESGLQGRVFLLGHRDDIGSLCGLADIFAHVSVREGLGMAPLEAMAKGLPLLSSYVNGMRDYTLDGVTGCCIQNPTDAAEAASAIKRLISRAGEWGDYGKANQAIARCFASEKSGRRMKEIYRRVRP